MALATFTDLKASIASWLTRDDLTAMIPDYITLCESRTNKRLRTRDMEDTATLTITGDGAYTLPTDYIEARRIRADVDPASALSPMSLDESTGYTTAGNPRRYLIQGNSLTVYPPNDANVTLDYYAAIPALSMSNPTNWLLTKAPEIYLWGSLLQSAPQLQDDQRLITWGNLYEAAIGELMKQNERGVYGKMISRIRGVTP